MKNLLSYSFTTMLLLILMIAAGGCTTTLTINNAYDRGAIFQTYQTYAWYSPVAGQGEDRTRTSYAVNLDQQVKAAVESGLVKEGMKPATGTPDVYLSYDVALETNTASTDGTIGPDFGYGYSYWYGYRFNYAAADFPGYRTIDSFSPGTIIVDIIDASTNTLVWRGWAETAITPATSDANRINRIVASIMAQYPPAMSRVF